MSWQSVPLGEVFEIARGGSPRPIDKFITDDPDGLNWVKIGDATASGKYILSTKEKIRKEGLSKTRAVEPGDFLLTNSMSFGRPYIMGTHGCIHDGWLVLKPRRDDTVSQDYMYHVLGSDEIKARFASRAPGSTVKNLNSTMVAETSIPLPPLEEQRRIAGILDAADALRRRRREALVLLDTLPGAIFSEMFGETHGAAEKADIRFVELASVADINPRMPRGLPDDMDVAFLPMAAVSVDGLIEYQEHRTVGQVRKGYTYFQRGDLLLAKITPCFENGKAAKTDNLETEHGFGTTEFHVVRTSPDILLPDYAFHLIWNPTFRKNGAANMTGSAGQKRIPVDYLKRMRIPLPNLEAQQKFVDRVRQLQNRRDDYTSQLSEIETLFASLQSRAFAGEL